MQQIKNAILKSNCAQKIQKKCKNIRTYLNTVKLIQKKDWYVEKLINEMYELSEFEYRTKADNIINICIYERLKDEILLENIFKKRSVLILIV